jgi:5,5'-dehydrodivanillate O-demethylase
LSGTNGDPKRLVRIPTWQRPIADPATGRWITSHVINQDFVTWVGQGRVADRSQEYLAPSDRGVVMIRRRFLDDIKAIAEGKPLAPASR